MKNKPISHKVDNTFKFESFRERLAKVNVSSVNYISKQIVCDDNQTNDSYFYHTICKWIDLNSTRNFAELRKSIGSVNSIQSLAQILLRKNELIDILIVNLKNKENGAINAVLELIVSLARDLRSLFYPRFIEIFSCLVEMIVDSTDPEVIENTFLCITYLFKFLCNHIIEDFESFFSIYAQKLLISTKDYIRKFASESFSYLIRKAQNKSDVLEILFNTVNEDFNLLESVSQLIFETIKGVNKQLHTCSHSFLLTLIEKYIERDSHYSDQLIYNVFQQIASYLTDDTSDLIWKILLNDIKCEKSLNKTIALIEIIVTHNNCDLVEDCSHLLNYLFKLLRQTNCDISTILSILTSIQLLVLYKWTQFNERDIKLINDGIYFSDCLSIEQVLQFTRKLFDCPKFENMFLPSVINFCEKFISSEEIIYFIKFFTELIIKKRERIIFGYDIESISIYQLKFVKSNDFEKNLMKIIKNESDLKLIWCCFVCLSHISSHISQTNKCSIIAQTIMKLQLKYEYQTEPWMGYVLIESIIALILLKPGMTTIHELPKTFLCDLFKSNPSNTSILRALDLYLAYNKKSSKDIAMDTSFLDKISLNLAQNLSSYSKINRICALHILTLLDVDSQSPDASILSNCLKAELTPTTVVDYRDKIKYLQNLDYSVVKHVNNDKLICLELMPFNYLVGALYENFKLLWTPILKLIEGFAKYAENKKQFVNILFSNVKNTSLLIYSDGIEYLKLYDDNVTNYLNCETNLLSYDMDRPDHSNHRILLLKAMEMFPEIVESNNREFVDIFLSFIENEMKTQLIFSCLSKEDISNLEEEDCNKNGAHKTLINKKPNITQKLFKTLFSFLNIFSKFKNPKALYRQPKLYKLFMDLLSYPNSEVQKGAFNCLFAYRHDYLNAFRDNFCRLIDEKTFKTEIYAIIDAENANILDNANRSDIVPILMRILYGKMILSNGTKTHGKNKSDFRRSLILKILTVFEESELIIFMDLIYAPIMHSLKLDCLFKLNYEALLDTTEEINIQDMIPLRQLQAMITTTLFISKHFGNKSTKITSYLYNVLIVTSSLVNSLLSNKFRGSLKESVIPVLKSIRSSSFKMAAKFFVLFDNYPYSSVQINALFDGLVEPVLVHLDKDSVTSPSPLLKLFAKCSENPRYHCFFGKQLSDKQMTPIDMIISLYSNEKTSQSVTSVINDIVENLLTFENFVEIKNESYSVPAIVINGSCFPSHDQLNDSELNFGSILLKPYASKILNRIQFTFNSNYSKMKSRKKRIGFTLQELNILLRLSAFISDSQECTTLVKLIIFSLDVNKLDEEKEIINLKALTQLSKHLLGTEVRGILKNCIPLFGTVKNRISRQELCTFFATLGQNETNMSNMIGAIININAFNPRFPEEPDYDTRLKGFKLINEIIVSKNLNELDVDTIYLIHHNCVHLINCCDDTAIRESASNTVKNLIIKLSESENEIFNLYIIKQLLLTSICNGIKVESETVRHEFIEILSTLIKHCSHRYIILEQLSKLNNDEDQEIDFWLNIKHIQLHRRARALTRLARDDELLKSFSNRVYASFLLPLASGFLFNKQYAKNPSLINSSIEAFGSFCKYISWSKYDSLLKNYTKLLITPKYDQKLIIKIISSILDNFNFNEALCDETETQMDIDIDHTTETKSDSDHFKKSNFNSLTKSKINNSIYNCLIPLLHQTLHQKSHIDFVHDAIKSDYPEDEDIQRIPIALAIIKLLKLLNSQSDILESNLPSVFLRICQFLRSKTESIRETARSILIKIMQSLGPNYVKYAFNEMKSSLAKGYQRHVFVYTIHAILVNLTQQLNCGDLDECLNSLVELCNLDLFGNLSDEKEVKQITSKVKEARKCKSYDIYFILSCFVSENSLTVLLDPLKSILLETYSYKVIKKVSLCLTKISIGLVDNKNLTLDVFLAFIYNIMNNPVEDKRIKKDAVVVKVTKPVKTHSFLISNKFINKKERIVKTNDLSKSYVLIEFGLNCFHFLIKQNKLMDLSDKNFSILNQFSPLLVNLLDSTNSKVGSFSLQCLYYLITKYPSMNSLTCESQNIIGKIFVLLKKYRSIDQSNSQLTSICYKTISLFLKDRNGLIDSDKIAVLISYAEQDIFHNTKQLTSFTLLKAILSRCPESKELRQIMKKLFEMCILSDSDVIRKKCRKVCVIYLVELSHQNKLKKQMNSFIRQLEYNDISGRESVIIIINDLVSRIPKDYLSANFVDIFIPLSSRLVNENASNCKKLVANTIKELLNRLDESERNTIFDNMLIPWLNDDQVLKRCIAAHLCSIFIDVEKNEFSKRLTSCLPLIRLQLDPTRYSNFDESLDQRIKIYDNLVYQLLNVCSKLTKVYPDIIGNKRWSENFNRIVEYIQSDYLLHAHVWIRMLSNQIFGQLFFYYCKDRIDQLVNAIINPSNHDEYMLHNSDQLIKNLCIKFCLIFRDIYNFNLLSDQLIHNLVSIGKVLIIVSNDNRINLKVSDSEDKSINLKWLMNKLLYEVKYEIKNNPNLVNKRIFVFKWIAAISALLGESCSERLEEYLPLFLPSLCREESQMNSDLSMEKELNELNLLTKDILNIIKGIIGSEKFSDFYTSSRNQLIMKRQERRKIRATEIVTNSMKSVKRKINKHRNDNRSKRRKIMT